MASFSASSRSFFRFTFFQDQASSRGGSDEDGESQLLAEIADPSSHGAGFEDDEVDGVFFEQGDELSGIGFEGEELLGIGFGVKAARNRFELSKINGQNTHGRSLPKFE
ncbi:MAG: hypothetical protein AAGD07_25555 [Planctomycetota bacterium]